MSIYLSIYLSIYIYISSSIFVCFVYCNIVAAHTHTMVTLVLYSNNIFQLALLDHCH